MMLVNGRAVTDEFAQNERAPSPRTFKRFKRDDSRAFAKRQTVAPRIKRTADRGRKRLQRIETRKNQLTERVVTAGDNALGLAVTN